MGRCPTAATVMAKLAGGGPAEPVRVQYRSFGDLAAVWSVLTQIGFAAIIDGRADTNAAVGRRGCCRTPPSV